MSENLPPEFDARFYRSSHQDLSQFGEKALRDHYEKYGRSEGRIATPAIPRQNFLELIPTDKGPVLEIGPFAKPVVIGPHVKYFDLMDRKALAERAKFIGEDPERVPNIDFVSPTGDLGVVNIKAAAAVSSHCIEHQPDMVRHLQHVQEILVPGGDYFLMIPDKRYCFDHFLGESTVAEVLDGYYSGRKAHTLTNVIIHRTMTTHNESARHWVGDHGELSVNTVLVEAAIQEFDASKGGYIDVHALTFTPDSFRWIIQCLYDLKLIGLRPFRVYDTPYGWNEFCAILRKD